MLKQFVFLLPFFSCLFFHVVMAGGEQLSNGGFSPETNPFTPKASLVRYWNKQIQNKSPGSAFLLSKASPLTAVASATFAKLASQNSLPDRLPDFCSAANLFCFPDLGPTLDKHSNDVKFSVYDQRNFTNYGTTRPGGADSFQKYSQNGNVVTDSFRRYSRDAAGHDDSFTGYADNSNVVDENFNSYGTSATGGSDEFKTYQSGVNNPTSRFTAYSDDGNGRAQTFKTYTHKGNAGPGQSFTSYGKNGNGAPNEFSSYGVSSNVIGSDFSNYGENANAANDTFKGYGGDGNVPRNNFKSYGASGNAAVDTFLNYRDKANVGDDTFSSYAKNSNSQKVNFVNYGKSFNPGSESFTGYGKGAEGNKIDFKTYTKNSTFKDYAKTGVGFARYNQSKLRDGKTVNKWVEPGKFFRESMLKEGTLIWMPDIKDKMPKRSFLPRSIVSKLPFSTSKIAEIKRVFHARDNSTMEGIITDAVTECERLPTVGETKRCVGSAEDIIDFATSVLGRSVVVRTTESVAGSKQKVMIGNVKGINGGNVTKSVSCHQSLYPYLLYYCHSVPKVRVYEADLLDPKSKAKINHGIGICHMDTSAWGASHGAFVSLGSRPGQIEVCHWIFENDMNWAIAD
ncbi:PREDICTED: polygalacturonase 1 beta-like protein 1 [Camelina sativa]|uniref:Polygalacturonase 1 beta-like protein 1 n=1 Tax=Camelina sativa TaxID=90675 RepID=A0ABM0VRP0_CAMSA|nr:PREDICTED: polygalacturonase 1 beta-like protein 1 [Camelina sativa]